MAKEEKPVESQPVKSKKDLFRERMSKKYPDINFDDEEDLYGKMNDDYDKNDQEISRYKNNESKLNDMFSSDPRSANFMATWASNGDPVVAFVKNFGLELKDAIDDPEKQKELAEANQEYVDRISKNKDLEKQYNENLAKTCDDINKMQEKEGISDEEIGKATQLLADITNDMVIGKISPESIRIALKALNHDDDVKEAATQGEVKGKNAKIMDKIKTENKTDGVPAITGKGKEEKSIKPNMGVLDRDQPDIWSGMKRTKYNNN